MTNAWDADREITIEEAVDAIRTTTYAGPLSSAAIVAAGWDNSVAVVDDDWVFRFPRREAALAGIQREIIWLPRLAAQLPVPVPVPEHVGTFGEPPWLFWGARRLPGHELAQDQAIDRVPIAIQVGRFLAELHALPLSQDLPVDPLGRADCATEGSEAIHILDELEASGTWVRDPTVDALLAAGSALGVSSATPVVCHGDLYSRHVLVDGDASVTGIIDWGDLCVAPPEVDLAIAFSAFTGESRTALLEAYGPLDTESVLRCQTLAIVSAAHVAAYACALGDQVLLAEALHALAGIA